MDPKAERHETESQERTVTGSGAGRRRRISHPSTETRPVRSRPDTSAPRLQQDIATRLLASREVLFGEDVARLRIFSSLVGSFCLGLVVLLPFLGGNIILRSVLWGGSLFSIFTSLWVYYALRDASAYDQRIINISTLLSVLIVYAGVLYLGIHSPSSLMVAPGIYFFARNQEGGNAAAMFLTCCLMQGLLATLILSGTIVDPGLITAIDAPEHIRIVTQVLIQLIYLVTFLLGRSSRRGTLSAMMRLGDAEARAQQREAAFLEVRDDLTRALGAKGAGHYSNEVLGEYRLGGIIGRGAMGEVYEAVHVKTAQPAAAKVLHPHVLAKPSSVERFVREAKAASALRSKHAIEIYDSSGPDDEPPYIIMERLTGHDLAHHLRQVGSLSVDEVVLLCRQVGSVLDLAAHKGIVHRDIKPQNLFFSTQSGVDMWKVLDFGTSKLSENSGTLTQGRVVGTPSYMTPQQACGEDVDPAADRYSLAAIAYRCLTGRAPYTGKDLPTTLYSVVYGTPPQPSLRSEVHPAVDGVLAVGMAKDPTQRFATSAAFADALEAAGRGVLNPQIEKRAEELLLKNRWGTLPTPKS